MKLKAMIDALSSGEWLIFTNSKEHLRTLKDNDFINQDGDSMSMYFTSPQDYEIYNEPKWYEREPFVKTVCKLKNGSLILIVGAVGDSILKDHHGSEWIIDSLIPLTRTELLAYAESAPDE